VTRAECSSPILKQVVLTLSTRQNFLSTLGYESRDFDGALLWFTTWDVWNRLEEGVGYRIIEAMHRASGHAKIF